MASTTRREIPLSHSSLANGNIDRYTSGLDALLCDKTYSPDSSVGSVISQPLSTVSLQPATTPCPPSAIDNGHTQETPATYSPVHMDLTDSRPSMGTPTNQSNGMSSIQSRRFQSRAQVHALLRNWRDTVYSQAAIDILLANYHDQPFRTRDIIDIIVTRPRWNGSSEFVEPTPSPAPVFQLPATKPISIRPPVNQPLPVIASPPLLQPESEPLRTRVLRGRAAQMVQPAHGKENNPESPSQIRSYCSNTYCKGCGCSANLQLQTPSARHPLATVPIPPDIPPLTPSPAQSSVIYRTGAETVACTFDTVTYYNKHSIIDQHIQDVIDRVERTALSATPATSATQDPVKQPSPGQVAGLTAPSSSPIYCSANSPCALRGQSFPLPSSNIQHQYLGIQDVKSSLSPVGHDVNLMPPPQTHTDVGALVPQETNPSNHSSIPLSHEVRITGRDWFDYYQC